MKNLLKNNADVLDIRQTFRTFIPSILDNVEA